MAASTDHARVVFPEEGRPQISTMVPRGSPPMAASRVGMPEEMHSHTRLSMSAKGDETRSPSAVSILARSNAECIESADSDREEGYTVHLYGSQCAQIGRAS